MTASMAGYGDPRRERAIRDRWLVRTSFLLAFFLEMVPLEADIVSVLWSFRAIFLVLVVKMACLMVIFLPLVIYVSRNGLSALKWVWGRVVLIAIIVSINLAHNILMVSGRI